MSAGRSSNGVTAVEREYVSFIASQWADPIADLAVAWRRRLASATDIRHVTLYDHGMSCAIVLQLLVMLESYTLRASWNTTVPVDALQRWSAFEWWKASSFPNKEGVLDAIVLRDVVAHNHLYFFDHAGSTPEAHDITHGGNKNFRTRAQRGRLLHTKLTCIPSKIGPIEVRTVVDIVDGALRWLAASYTNVDADFHFARRGHDKTLWHVLRSTLDVACARVSDSDGTAPGDS